MKIGKDAKVKLGNDPFKVWLLESLLECSTKNKSMPQYEGIYFNSKINYWYSTDGFRLFAVSASFLDGKDGKYIPKPFAENLSLEPVPETSKWNPDISMLLSKSNPKVVITMDIPKIMSAADSKKYEGHMTLNFENSGYFTYLGKLPEEKLATDHIHFNMHNWNHLGGQTARLLYYGKDSSILVLPAKGTNRNALEEPWFSLIMPTRQSGEELIREVKMV